MYEEYSTQCHKKVLENDVNLIHLNYHGYWFRVAIVSEEHAGFWDVEFFRSQPLPVASVDQ